MCFFSAKGMCAICRTQASNVQGSLQRGPTQTWPHSAIVAGLYVSVRRHRFIPGNFLWYFTALTMHMRAASSPTASACTTFTTLYIIITEGNRRLSTCRNIDDAAKSQQRKTSALESSHRNSTIHGSHAQELSWSASCKKLAQRSSSSA